MYVYAVNFALKPDDSHSERLERLMAELQRTPNGMIWAETPSFALVQSDERLQELADRIWLRAMAATDTILVFDHHSNMAVARGPIADKALLKAHFRSCEIR